ncbi:hypothetical protein SAMN05443144_12162 [Fodinibius roseus]|uniref:Uncharacterized protein n=1 Tax=Fodinibius roseus TaxID=1194090 RepID=A0A1M5HXP8_9BACT|nr:hypothetical protein [Fodinibius roseus]SHG20781.1 hypothetical protein SAMN05443144_12162 [Fodinibius roseus]
MIDFSELEKKIDLSNFERNLGNKRTKAGKYFWLFVLINYKEAKKGNISFDIRMVCGEYSNIFFRPYEAIHNMLKLYEGLPTATMREKLIIEESKEYFALKFKKNALQLESELREWLSNHDFSFEHISPEVVEFIDLDFLDNRQTYLPLISRSYKRLLDAANHLYLGNRLPVDPQWELKPSSVKSTFNDVMDTMMRYKYLIHVVDHIRDYLNTSYDTFHSKTRVEGPTQAVRELFTFTPEASEYTNKQLKYHLKLNFADLDGEDFNNDSVRKAIKKHRDEQSK